MNNSPGFYFTSAAILSVKGEGEMKAAPWERCRRRKRCRRKKRCRRHMTEGLDEDGKRSLTFIDVH